MLSQKEYIKNPNRCPVCEAETIEAGSTEISGNQCHQYVYCLDCGCEWFDVYTLTGFLLEEETQNQISKDNHETR